MLDILKLLSRDSTLSDHDMAVMLGIEESELRAAIAEYENHKVILGYKAIIDWEKAGEETVTAIIEVKVTPQRGEGFDRVAERIYQYDEVESLYLMSGGYDLTVFITGRTMKDVALFVAKRLATIDGVTGTATHFILKKYKESGMFFENGHEGQERIDIL